MKKLLLIVLLVFCLTAVFAEEPTLEELDHAADLFDTAGREFDEAQGLYTSANSVMERVEAEEDVSLREIDDASEDFEEASGTFAQAEENYSEANGIFGRLEGEEEDVVAEEPVYVEDNTPVDPYILYTPTYALNKSDLSDDEKMNIEDSVLSLMDPSASKYTINGHTDSISTDEYNQKLSVKRAKSVMNYLIGLGVPVENITIKGFGESDPVADNETKEGRAQNRRADIVVE
ncbi:OmpA family protein [bacterium]|nr:OmpA family protein [bacterium]